MPAPGIAKQIDAKSLQLTWFSPIEIRGLVVRDPAGQPLAEVPLIKSHKPASETFRVFEPVPQLLKNVRVSDATRALEAKAVIAAIAAGEKKLGKVTAILPSDTSDKSFAHSVLFSSTQKRL